MAFSLAYNLTVSVRSNQAMSITLFNVTWPEAGDWFMAAHLPKDDGKIEQQVDLQHTPSIEGRSLQCQHETPPMNIASLYQNSISDLSKLFVCFRCFRCTRVACL